MWRCMSDERRTHSRTGDMRWIEIAAECPAGRRNRIQLCICQIWMTLTEQFKLALAPTDVSATALGHWDNQLICIIPEKSIEKG